MHCLWCDRQIVPEIGWDNIFVLSKPILLCQVCEKRLKLLQGKRCSRCSRQSTEMICTDCKWWEEQGERNSIIWNHSVFSYNPFMQEVISKWKYRGDYVLGAMFKQYFIQAFRKRFTNFKNDVLIVPIPLSKERFLERGFNQAKMLATFLPVETKEAITRVHGEKQSKKTRQERIFTTNPFLLRETINKSVILVDDIYTTGTTLRHAGALLKEHGCPEVYALTLIRG